MTPADHHIDEDTIVRYVQGHLDTEALHGWDRHLDRCSPCRRLLAEVAKSGVLDDEPEPLDFQDRTNVTAPQAMEPSGLFAVGEMVDHYKIMRTIGRGGMGEVFLARDTKLGRKVALKVILSRYLGSKAVKERFMFEARATANFSHPHIVAIYGVGEVHDRPYVALEYLDGDSLRDRLIEERPSIWTTLRIALAIAEALAEAHAHDILHRDLKPENIIIPSDGRLRVVDFGLARAVSTDPTRARAEHGAGLMTRRPTNIEPLPTEAADGGTPAYMAPEQWRGQPTTAAADIWSLGVILYELVTGHRPYGDVAGTPESLQRDVLATAPVPTLENVRALPTRVPALIYRCLVKQAQRRPTAREVADELQEMLAFRHTKIEDEAEPFVGLRSMSANDAPRFFGRDAEVDALVEQIRAEPIVTVLGPSGTGKTSLVAAGLGPRLSDLGGWHVLHTRPGDDPMGALRAAVGLNAKPPSPDQDETKLLFDDGTIPARRPLAVELMRIAQTERTRVLLVIDQLEELFDSDPVVQRDFLEAIDNAADDAAGPVRVLLVLREDLIGQLAAAPRLTRRVTVVRRPTSTDLRDMLIRTAESAGLTFEGDDLLDTIATDLGDDRSGLSLLQLVGGQLWLGRDRRTKQLTKETYVAMGGVSGALREHADAVLAALAPDRAAYARELLSQLVDDDGAPRSIPWHDASGVEAEVRQQLVDTRLIGVRRSTGLEGGRIHLAHDALADWPRMLAWREHRTPTASPKPTNKPALVAVAILSALLILATVNRWFVGQDLQDARTAWAAAEYDAARAAADARRFDEAAGRARVALELRDDAATRAIWTAATGVSLDARLDHCAVLRVVWQHTPFVWHDGNRVERAPDHACD